MTKTAFPSHSRSLTKCLNSYEQFRQDFQGLHLRGVPRTYDRMHHRRSASGLEDFGRGDDEGNSPPQIGRAGNHAPCGGGQSLPGERSAGRSGHRRSPYHSVPQQQYSFSGLQPAAVHSPSGSRRPDCGSEVFRFPGLSRRRAFLRPHHPAHSGSRLYSQANVEGYEHFRRAHRGGRSRSEAAGPRKE